MARAAPEPLRKVMMVEGAGDKETVIHSHNVTAAEVGGLALLVKMQNNSKPETVVPGKIQASLVLSPDTLEAAAVQAEALQADQQQHTVVVLVVEIQRMVLMAT